MKSLTQAKRDQARQRARRSIERRIGQEPERAQFNNYVASKYPRWFTVLMSSLLAGVALAAGFISGVRLYVAGFHYARETVPFSVSILIGACTVAAAELLVIVAAVTGQIYLVGRRKIISYIPVALGVVVAFVGNWTVTDPVTTWGWVETIFPPVAVLSVAFFFEITLVPELERRQADDLEYQRARHQWRWAMDHIEDHSDWWPVFATALRDELIRSNSMSVEDLDPDDWRTAVEAEMNAEQWWNSGGIPGNTGKRSKPTRKSGGGLVNSMEGDGSQVDKVLELFKANPDLADKRVTPVSEATELLGVGNSTYYKAQALYERNGHESADSN